MSDGRYREQCVSAAVPLNNHVSPAAGRIKE